MEARFFQDNRRNLMENLAVGTVALFFSGEPVRKTADAMFPFFVNRNFVYLTGLGDLNVKGFVLMLEKAKDGTVTETLYLLPADAMAERWTGRRMTGDEARQRSGIEAVRTVDAFLPALHTALASGRVQTVALDLDRFAFDELPGEAERFAATLAPKYPAVTIQDVHPALATLRTVKAPCEIAAMRKAIALTGEAIARMMQAVRPGVTECQLKAIFDGVLTDNGVLSPAFPPIISTGNNNFSIHYEEYSGVCQAGDMVLNDVGAICDYLCCDISRAYPMDGVFSERQKLLYQAAYDTSEYMFALLKPGFPTDQVDSTARKFVFEKLKAIGLVERYEDVGRYIWHGGAHHVGFDTHDVVERARPAVPGMVFCVDVGIYVEEWGIGFRLEDNCLITETGCENLTRAVPRTIEAIEQAMRKGGNQDV